VFVVIWQPLGIETESAENKPSSSMVMKSFSNLGVGHVTPSRRDPICHS
jgi:hypothetical protein